VDGISVPILLFLVIEQIKGIYLNWPILY